MRHRTLWVLTRRCNVRCPFCDIFELIGKREEGDWKEIAERVVEIGYPVCLSGGEPTLHEHFDDIVNFLADHVPVVVETNLSTGFRQCFARCIQVTVNLSSWLWLGRCFTEDLRKLFECGCKEVYPTFVPQRGCVESDLRFFRVNGLDELLKDKQVDICLPHNCRGEYDSRPDEEELALIKKFFPVSEVIDIDSFKDLSGDPVIMPDGAIGRLVVKNNQVVFSEEKDAIRIAQ